VFRLSRFTGPVRSVGPPGAVTVPADVDLRALVSASTPPDRTRTATLWVRQGAGHALRRYARPVAAPPAPAAGSAEAPSGAGGSGGGTPAGMDLLEIDYADTERLARWVVGYGGDVLVVAPPGLRAEVVRRLRATLRATRRTHRPTGDAAGPDDRGGRGAAPAGRSGPDRAPAGPDGGPNDPDGPATPWHRPGAARAAGSR
jgi:hypothetical protein